MHQPDAILERHHPGKARRRVLTHRVADQNVRLHPPAHPQLGQRIFGDHDQRQLHRRPLQRLVRHRLRARFGQPQRLEVIIEPRLKHLQPAIHPFREHRLGLVKVPRHAGILRPAAGKHEHDLGVIPHNAMLEHPPRVVLFQQRCRLFPAFGHHDPAFLECPPPLFQGPGHIGQRIVAFPQMRRQRAGIAVQRRLRFRRHHQQLERPVALFAGLTLRRFFQHDMRVGPANAEAVDPRPPRPVARHPRRQPVIHHERRMLEINRRVRIVITKAGRHLPVFQRQRCLDQARHPGRSVQMPDIGLHRSDPAEPGRVGRLAERLGQRGHLDRIAQIGAGAVAFDVIHRLGRHARNRLCLGHRRRLPVD